MNTTTAQQSISSLYNSAFSLTPSTLITLYQIDVQQLVTNRNLNNAIPLTQMVYYFHNMVHLGNTAITWQGQGYIAAPIIVEGFESVSKGTNPIPKMSISVNEAGIPLLATLKSVMAQLGDFSGGKVTRIRTLAKYLDSVNFQNNDAPPGFSPDPNAQFSQDVYFIDRKSQENKFTIQFELASLMDVEGIQLPLRLCLASRCVFNYRGEGCMYEYNSRRVPAIHGQDALLNAGNGSYLPLSAPPVATYNNELIAQIIAPYQINDLHEPWSFSKSYQVGDGIFIPINGINYYYVAAVPSLGVQPPNTYFWIQDECSHTIDGCKIRWGAAGSVVIDSATPLAKGNLNFGGFPGTDRIGKF